MIMEHPPAGSGRDGRTGDDSFLCGRQWRGFWNGHSVESEIAMADFYGLRHVLLKFLPRQGTILEAGCGLGRYVFYLRALGLRVVGCDTLLPAVAAAQQWALHARPESADVFGAADVRHLPFRDHSLSGYVSLGVVEHFREGPAAAIAEAYRVLRPGGIAIVEVPSAQALDLYVHRVKRALGGLAGRAGACNPALHEEPIRPAALGELLRGAGFAPLFCGAVDVIYPVWSLGVGPRWYGALHLAEGILARWGGLAVAVGIKPGERMACFVCGADCTASPDLAVACCERCRGMLPPDVLAAYTPDLVAGVRWCGLGSAEALAGERCSVCRGPYSPDEHFGNWGFAAPVCCGCVRQPEVNLTLAQRAVQRIWRARAPQAA